MLKKLLKKISFLRKKRKIKLLQNLFKESDGVSLLDVGAAGNIMPRWVSVARYLNYIGVEPDKRTNQELKNIYNCKSYELIENILWNEETNLTFNLCRLPTNSSSYLPNKEFLDRFSDSKRFEVTSIENLKSSTLEKELSLLGRQVDFVKMDIQGGELNALKGMGDYLNKCIGLELEVEFVEIYKNQPLFSDISIFLKNKGFEFIDFVKLYRWERLDHRPPYGQCIFADGIWLKSPEDISREGIEVYKKYISICSIYGRFDLIMKLLEIKNLDLSDDYISSINKLIRLQKIERKTNKTYNKILRFLTGDFETESHLVY